MIEFENPEMASTRQIVVRAYEYLPSEIPQDAAVITCQVIDGQVRVSIEGNVIVSGPGLHFHVKTP